MLSDKAIEAALKAAPKFWRDYGSSEYHMRNVLTAALAADGLALVPKEPTEIMRASARRLNHPRDEEIYRAMIASASAEADRPAATSEDK